MNSDQMELLKRHFDDVTLDKHGYVVRKQRDELLLPEHVVKKIQTLIPSAVIVDSYHHGGFITVEFFC
jgi:hypothetical protein